MTDSLVRITVCAETAMKPSICTPRSLYTAVDVRTGPPTPTYRTVATYIFTRSPDLRVVSSFEFGEKCPTMLFTDRQVGKASPFSMAGSK